MQSIFVKPGVASDNSLVMIQGINGKGIKFTAFVLLDSKNGIKIEKGSVMDLTSLNVIYKTFGHNITETVINDVNEYAEYYIAKRKLKEKNVIK